MTASRLACLLAGAGLLCACAVAGGGPDGASGQADAADPPVGGNPGSGGRSAGGSSGAAGLGAGGSQTPGVGGTVGGGGTGAGGNRPSDGGSDAATSTGDARGGAGGAAGSPAGTGGTSGASGSHWVGTWGGAPQLTEVANLPPAPLSNSTLRQVVHVSLGGDQIRVRFSNEFGDGPLTINQAHVAVCPASPVDSSIDPTTDRALSFSGRPSITIAQGAAVWSEPLAFSVAALGNLSITIAFGSVPGAVTGHPGSRTTSYQQAGAGNLGAASLAAAQPTDHWYVLSGVDVLAGAGARAVVVLGDSISDGRGSTTNRNDRWPDDLARRVSAGGGPPAAVAVINQGIGGNAVTAGGLGPTALARFSRDVLGQSGARWVILFEGVNDLGGGVGAPAITSAFANLIAQAHAQALLAYGATITPFGSNAYYTAAHESARQAVNAYIKSGVFDGTIDFDAAVRDSSSPPRLQAAYDSGDGLHLNPAGYQKLADTVDLTLFAR